MTMSLPIYAYRIAPDDTIEFVNDAWLRFAAENAAPTLPREVLGSSLWRHVAGVEVRHLYQHLVAKVRNTGREVSTPFRCDSPGVRRFMRMRISALPQDRVEFGTWIERVEAYAHPVGLLDPAAPRDHDRLLRMCAWCKCIDAGGTWLELERAIDNLRLLDTPTLPAITHGICEACCSSITSLLANN
jgi:hypothetical protein